MLHEYLAVGNYLFVPAFLIQLLSVVPSAAVKDEKKSFVISNIVLLFGLVIGLISTLSLLLFNSNTHSINSDLFFSGWIRLDGLGLYFLFIIQLVAIPTSIYNFSYMQHYIEQKRPVKNFVVFYSITIISTQLVVIANQAIFFLVSWEVMSVASYLGMVLEKEKEDVQKGSFYYFIACHVVVFMLYIFFFLLHHETNSWFLSDYHLSATDSILIPLIFILSFIGFGIKAGFMPMHFWLPQAHPIAPTVLSAFLSGVIIKTGIYGILRTIQFIDNIPVWFGWFVLAVGLFSAIFGVWYALAQHDIKRLLAYHSVENIGIIGMGIGVGLIGSAYSSPVIQALGFGGALLHTLNHAIFKSLLFVGSGVVYQNLGTRNIELMGGIVHRAKYLAVLFLIGSVAISGIPPLNGFISEFIIYNGFFQTAGILKNYYPLVMLISVVGLAFVGGLAVACFTKINSIMFLGTERKEVKHFHVSIYDYISLGIFAALCIVIGFYPQPFVELVNNVVNTGFIHGSYSNALVNMNWFLLSVIFSSVLAGILILYFVKKKIQNKYGRRTSPAWACGYEDLNTRMQYTASSFADELNTIPKKLLVYDKHVEVSKTAFPVKSQFESHSHDFVDSKIVIPGIKLFERAASKFEFLSQTDIRFYIAFILLIITVYGFIAFLWV